MPFPPPPLPAFSSSSSFGDLLWISTRTFIVIQHQTGHAAEAHDDESDEEEEEELDIDPLVAMEETAHVASTAAGGAGQPRRQHSIAHDDIEGKVVYIDTVLELVNHDDLIQLSWLEVVWNSDFE